MNQKPIAVVVMGSSRFEGKTVQAGETLNTLVARGPEMTAALIQEFFDSRKHGFCVILNADGESVTFVREQDTITISFGNYAPENYNAPEPPQGEKTDGRG